MRSNLIVAVTALAVVGYANAPSVWAEEDGAIAPGSELADIAPDAGDPPETEVSGQSPPIAASGPDGPADAEDAVASVAAEELTEALLQPDLDLTPEASPAALDLSAESHSGGPLGSIGYDAKGNPGRIHVVIVDDTLWDISAAYLGSAWVWPSIWKDNGEIENPHLIRPGDRIWITDTEMRRVSKAEAAELLAGRPPEPAEQAELPPPAPLPPPEPEYVPPPERPTVRISRRESADLVTAQQLETASSIVDAVPERQMLSQGDRVYVGLGGGDVAVGDQFTVFRTHEKVFDPDTGELLGYHVDVVGWVQVEESHPETSIARIWQSDAAIGRGDRLMPRQPLSLDVPVQDPPMGVEGKISFFADSRTISSHVDFVYLNRGSNDGLIPGSPLEVFRRSYTALETARDVDVAIPARAVAQLIVVRANLHSAVAFVAHTNVELVIGDEFRAATRERAQRRLGSLCTLGSCWGPVAGR